MMEDVHGALLALYLEHERIAGLGVVDRATTTRPSSWRQSRRTWMPSLIRLCSSRIEWRRWAFMGCKAPKPASGRHR
jgi:hypothetical protein